MSRPVCRSLRLHDGGEAGHGPLARPGGHHRNLAPDWARQRSTSKRVAAARRQQVHARRAEAAEAALREVIAAEEEELGTGAHARLLAHRNNLAVGSRYAKCPREAPSAIISGCRPVPSRTT